MSERLWNRSRHSDDSRVLEAHAAAAEVTVLPPDEAIREVRARRECRTVEFAELMLGLARDQRSTSPRDQGILARLAIAALERLGSSSTEREIATLALAWAELGNSLRIRGKLTKAPHAIEVAIRLIDSLPDSPVKIDVLALNASYHERRRELARAEQILCRAERLANRIGTTDQLLRIWILQADVLDQRFDYRRSWDHLLTTLQLAALSNNRRLTLCCIHNLARCLVNATEARRGLELLHSNAQLYEAHGTPRTLLCRAWLTGRALRDLGRFDEAGEILLRVRSGFAAEGCLYEAAGVSLSLLKLYATASRPAEAEEAAIEIQATAEAHGLRHQQHLAEAYLQSGNLASLRGPLSIW